MLIYSIIHSHGWEGYQQLKVGTHEYFGQTIETTPIRTTFSLCYKVESKSIFGDGTAIMFWVYKIGIKSMKLYVAADNTWQGVIYRQWPNTKNPLSVVGKFSTDSHNSHLVPIEVTERSHLKGNGNFSQCIAQKESIGQSCKSIFHPNSNQFENKFVSQQL